LRTGCWGKYLSVKREEATKGWRNLHNEELYHFVFIVKYYWDANINENGMDDAFDRHGRGGKCIKFSIG
jgi:hypothetical protein